MSGGGDNEEGQGVDEFDSGHAHADHSVNRLIHLAGAPTL